MSNFSLEEGDWVICLWQHHISKMGYFKCTILFNICTISFLWYYDIGCTMFTEHTMVLLISALANNGATKPIFLDSGSSGREGGSCVRGHGLLSLHSSYTKFK